MGVEREVGREPEAAGQRLIPQTQQLPFSSALCQSSHLSNGHVGDKRAFGSPFSCNTRSHLPVTHSPTILPFSVHSIAHSRTCDAIPPPGNPLRQSLICSPSPFPLPSLPFLQNHLLNSYCIPSNPPIYFHLALTVSFHMAGLEPLGGMGVCCGDRSVQKTHLSESLPAGAKPSSNPFSLPNQDSQLLGRPGEVRWLLIVLRGPALVVEAAFERGDLEEGGFGWEQLRQLGKGRQRRAGKEYVPGHLRPRFLFCFGRYSQAPSPL